MTTPTEKVTSEALSPLAAIRDGASKAASVLVSPVTGRDTTALVAELGARKLSTKAQEHALSHLTEILANSKHTCLQKLARFLPGAKTAQMVAGTLLDLNEARKSISTMHASPVSFKDSCISGLKTLANRAADLTARYTCVGLADALILGSATAALTPIVGPLAAPEIAAVLASYAGILGGDAIVAAKENFLGRETPTTS